MRSTYPTFAALSVDSCIVAFADTKWKLGRVVEAVREFARWTLMSGCAGRAWRRNG